MDCLLSRRRRPLPPFRPPLPTYAPPNLWPRSPRGFFVGGSVNPGGGMPMVVLCGQNVARAIVAWDRV